MFKRQVFLLALLEEFEGKLSSTEMMKYLFLLSQHQAESSYHFVPYKYGCFSFTAYADKRKLIEMGKLKDTEDWELPADHEGFFWQLSRDERASLKKVKEKFGHLRGRDLIRYVYLQYPYYSLKSEILTEILSKEEVSKVKAVNPPQKTKALYTIGYEGRSIEEYINCLIKEDVKILCDVRKNPQSRKYGFSKKTLENALNSVGIAYKHFPDLGIEGEARQDLQNLGDYERLFDLYETEVIAQAHDVLEAVYQLLLTDNRIGLTCFERDPAYCHRTRVAQAILQFFNPDLELIEL